MKKLFVIAMMVAVAATSFAQDIVKQMKGQDYDAALATLNAALPSLSAEQKAKGYNQLVEVLMPEVTKAVEKTDLNAADLIANALNAAVACDEFDNQPNDKGKVAPKFHKKNQERLNNARFIVLQAVNNYLNVDNKKALKLIVCYLEGVNAPLFGELKDQRDALYAPQFYRIAGLIAFQEKDYPTAVKYARIAMNDPQEKEDAEKILVAALEQQLSTRQDTLDFIQTMKEVDASKYFGRITSFLERVGEKEQAAQLIEEELARNPENKMAWAIKGESAMNARSWEQAIEAFKKTVEIDPSFTAVWFNLGVCAYSWAADLQEQLSDKQGKITAENNKKVNDKIAEAKTYYEKVRELDPSYQEIPNWPRQLRMVYNALGETEKAAEITRMLGEE